MTKIIFLFIFLCSAVFVSNAQIKSVYTDLSDTKCKTLEVNVDEGGVYLGECLGTAGYKLHLRETDLRQTIDIITPKNEQLRLKFWYVSSAFNAVGPRAEWRIRNKKPIALIVRLNANEDLDDSSKNVSYLIVSKITDTEACITDVVKPSRSQNDEARKLADSSASKPCLYTNEDF